MGNPFGPGSPTKLDLYHMDRNDLRDVDKWTATGTNQTAAVAVDATYGQVQRSTLGGADNDEGSLTLDLGAIFHPAAGDKFEFEGMVKPTEAGTDNMDWMFGCFDTLENVFTDTATTASTSADFIGVGKVAGSLFGRAFAGNDATQYLSGATTFAITSAKWYRCRIIGECQTDGVHARFYMGSPDNSQPDTLLYTLGYGSGNGPLAVSGFTAMYFGVTHKATDSDAEVIDFLPLKLRIEQSGS